MFRNANVFILLFTSSRSVENCGLCMRQCLASSSYAHVMHCALVITCMIGYYTSVKHWIMRNCKLPSRILDILILQDKTLFCAFEAGDIVCWLVNQPIAKLDLFKSPDCRWICKTYAEYCCRSSATVRRLVQSPTLQSTIFCGVHSDLRGKGIRVSPACYRLFHSRAQVITFTASMRWTGV